MRALLVLVCLPLAATAQTARLEGIVRDAGHKPVAAAAVSLSGGEGKRALTAETDAQGLYRFGGLVSGSYTLRVEKAWAGVARFGPFLLSEKELRTIDLTLAPASAQAPQFYDEPQFVVAGVTDSTYQGGHGSDVVLRSADALAKATAALAHDAPGSAAHADAEAAERAGKPLEAVRLYQRAAEMDPSEPNLFDWGTELLIHRAAAPAVEVFGKGNRLFPESSRMVLGLAAAWYARGAYDQAAKYFLAACDLNPSDPTPYLFLGGVESPVITESDSYMERLARFARLHPENALANYYYAAGLWKRSKGPEDMETPARVSGLLQKAIQLDPKLARAYLLLGIVDSSSLDFAAAVTEYRKAIELSSDMEEAHYRLSQAYRRMGRVQQARDELDLYKRLSKKAAEALQRERNAVPQFAVTLRDLPAH